MEIINKDVKGVRIGKRFFDSMLVENTLVLDTNSSCMDYTNATVKDTEIKDCNFNHDVFISSDFTNTVFYKCTFYNVVFDKCNFLDTYFNNCTFINTTYNKAYFYIAKEVIWDAFWGVYFFNGCEPSEPNFTDCSVKALISAK